jgi:hypothetical protein
MTSIHVDDPVTESTDSRIVPAPPPVMEVPRLLVLQAFTLLCLVDLLLKTRGYAYLRRLLTSRLKSKNVASETAQAESQARALAAIDRAAVFYPHRAMCLQRSTVLLWLLRRRDVPAQMVIGCRHTPFYAHAWVERGGVVINDRDIVKQEYLELERV